MNNKRDLSLIFGSSFVSIIVVLLLVLSLATIYRDQVFHYFASHYLLQERLTAGLDTSKLNGATTPTKSFFAQEAQVIETVAKASPAVVSIVVTKDVPVIEQYFDNFNPFEDFFGGGPFGGFNFQIPRERQNGTEKREVGGGTGFFVSADGLAVTNKHVVADTTASYTAITSSGKKYEVEVLAKDPVLDIAIIRVKGESNFSYLSFDDSDKIKVGQTAIAIGNALGEFENTVSVGVVSGLYRSIIASDNFGEAENLDEVIQTDAAINPGNSGGPLLDLRGKVIGVNVAVARGSENIGFALPSNTVAEAVKSVQENKKIIRPYLGVRYTAITPTIKEKNKLAVDYGALVLRGERPEDLAVIPGSPADKAGIVENDIILEIDGIKLEADRSLASLIRNKAVGQIISLKIWHRGEIKNVKVTLEKAPE